MRQDCGNCAKIMQQLDLNCGNCTEMTQQSGTLSAEAVEDHA